MLTQLRGKEFIDTLSEESLDPSQEPNELSKRLFIFERQLCEKMNPTSPRFRRSIFDAWGLKDWNSNAIPTETFLH